MECEAHIEQWNNSDTRSFARPGIEERLPRIITTIIDDVYRTLSDINPATDDQTRFAEGKLIISELVDLKYEMQHDHEMTLMNDDGLGDVDRYNSELYARGELRWHSAPWLFSECYMFRKIKSFFGTSTKWKSYDYFARQKNGAFKSSRPAVVELATHYRALIQSLESKSNPSTTTSESKNDSGDDNDEATVFAEMAEICLWGNATDLALLQSVSPDSLKHLQGSKARAAARSRIISNHTSQAYAALSHARAAAAATSAMPTIDPPRRVDIVLDNAGFELFSDLVWAGYLIASNLASVVVVHPKTIPWYVSDTTGSDFGNIIAAVADPASFFASTPNKEEKLAGIVHEPMESDDELGPLRFVFDHWSNLHADGKLVVRPHRFWSEAGSFWRMPVHAPGLLEDLVESELVVFKGDLNYRKLTADGMWDPTTPFPTALGPLGPGSRLRILSLRTCKSDVVVGLEPGLDEQLKRDHNLPDQDPDSRSWAWNGRFGVIQFSDGKASDQEA